MAIKKQNNAKIIENATVKFGEFLTALGFDWAQDPNQKDTPARVAKMYVNELYQGIFHPAPKITAFDNTDKYDGIVFEGNITLNSSCAHHCLPFIGKAHVAYIPGKKVIGLSKLNRIVEYFAKRPQIQESLTMQIHDYVNTICEGNNGVAVVIEAAHQCTCIRGVGHNSTMMTSKLSGAFTKADTKREFYEFISNLRK